MPYVASRDGTRIGYERTGRGPVVILIDGALGYRGYRGGRPLAEALSADFSVIAYDRRGRGESTDRQPYAVEREIEDIEALIAESGWPVGLYGFSSGSVLALRAAAALGPDRVAKLAVLEPPFGGDDDRSRQEFGEYCQQMEDLLKAGRRGDAVAFFLQDMLPPVVLDDMKQSPDWVVLKAVAPTLAYDNQVMGDGAVPAGIAAAVAVPSLVLDGGESPDFKHAAADALARALPRAHRRTLAGETTLVPPEVLAPVLTAFFR
jgi:pimeloyl-ACP methyl ester carboxylesterase